MDTDVLLWGICVDRSVFTPSGQGCEGWTWRGNAFGQLSTLAHFRCPQICGGRIDFQWWSGLIRA
eukprot:1184565-Prorocentrum_minimum.AAC.1